MTSSSSRQCTQNGIPPPPPPRQSEQNDIGSLCPPPPPPMNVHQYHPQFQPMMQTHHVAIQHNSSGNYNQMYQYYHRGIHHQQPLQYQQQHTNYTNIPPPPPKTGTMQQQNNLMSNQQSMMQPFNPTIHAPPQRSQTRNEDPPYHSSKKINPKMAKKYSGRGLKTITIAGPGIPTQKFKICVGNHPEDVKKWIAERRKRFPRAGGCDATNSTSMNVCLADAAARGKRDREKPFVSANVESKKQCVDGAGGGALSSLLAGYDSSSSEGEVVEHRPNNEEKAARQSDHTTENTPAKLNTSSEGPTRACVFFKRGKCRHGDSCKFLHTASDAPGDTNQGKRKTQSEHDKARRAYDCELQALGLLSTGQSHRNGQNKHVNNTSLLNKLLQRDKERERHLTLQLLRHIVDNDFFQGQIEVNDQHVENANEHDDAAVTSK